MSEWPSVGIIRSALRGIREVFVAPCGETVAGARSSVPWVYMTVMGNGAFASCDRCSTSDPFPPPPTAGGLNGKGEPLFGIKTKDYSMFVLARFLYPFYETHVKCEESK